MNVILWAIFVCLLSLNFKVPRPEIWENFIGKYSCWFAAVVKCKIFILFLCVCLIAVIYVIYFIYLSIIVHLMSVFFDNNHDQHEINMSHYLITSSLVIINSFFIYSNHPCHAVITLLSLMCPPLINHLCHQIPNISWKYWNLPHTVNGKFSFLKLKPSSVLFLCRHWPSSVNATKVRSCFAASRCWLSLTVSRKDGWIWAFRYSEDTLLPTVNSLKVREP